MKNLKIFGIILIILLGLITYVNYSVTTINKLKTENFRICNNLTNAEFKIDSFKTKNGELFKSVNSLELKGKELEFYNSKLSKELNQMGFKLSAISSVTSVNSEIIYCIDTIDIEKANDTTFNCKYDDKWLKLSQQINLVNKHRDITIDSLQIKIPDSLLIVHTINYKGWWFWKKAIGLKLNIKSQNPHTNINRIEFYDLMKK